MKGDVKRSMTNVIMEIVQKKFFKNCLGPSQDGSMDDETYKEEIGKDICANII